MFKKIGCILVIFLLIGAAHHVKNHFAGGFRHGLHHK